MCRVIFFRVSSLCQKLSSVSTGVSVNLEAQSTNAAALKYHKMKARMDSLEGGPAVTSTIGATGQTFQTSLTERSCTISTAKRDTERKFSFLNGLDEEVESLADSRLLTAQGGIQAVEQLDDDVKQCSVEIHIKPKLSTSSEDEEQRQFHNMVEVKVRQHLERKHHKTLYNQTSISQVPASHFGRSVPTLNVVKVEEGQPNSDEIKPDFTPEVSSSTNTLNVQNKMMARHGRKVVSTQHLSSSKTCGSLSSLAGVFNIKINLGQGETLEEEPAELGSIMLPFPPPVTPVSLSCSSSSSSLASNCPRCMIIANTDSTKAIFV